jgi:hypothetical protein
MDHSKMKHIMTDEGMVMVHGGVPGWLFAVGVGVVILITFFVVERRGSSTGEGFRLTLARSNPLYILIRKRWFQPLFQIPVLVVFSFIIYAGLFGSYGKNIAPVVVWTVWWAGLIFGVALMGNVWCFMCPWDAMANLGSRLAFWRRKDTLSMGLKLPAWARNVYPATVLFVLVTWAELGWGITNDARMTATLGLLMGIAALGMALVFERKAFCRTFCFVGRTSGVYSMFAPFEIRPRNEDACKVCKTRACLTGNNQGYSCPTGLDMGELNENNYCTLCTECIKSCNVPTVRIRPFARDLSRVKNWRTDEAVLALSLLALTGFHGLSMTPVWQNLEPGTRDMVGMLQQGLGVDELGAFTVGMAGLFLLPFAVYGALTWVAWRWVAGSGRSYRDLFVGYAYSVLPVALFYHLAHNAMHLFMEGQQVIPLLSDPMGTGADWFGTATWHLEPLLSMEAIWLMQVILVCIGHVFGVTVAHRISRRMFTDPAWAKRSLIPMTTVMVLLSVGGLWLMSLDMNMRGRM